MATYRLVKLSLELLDLLLELVCIAPRGPHGIVGRVDDESLQLPLELLEGLLVVDTKTADCIMCMKNET